MAITTTLSRLKNYFIGWHTANYRILHEFTDRITDEEPDGSKLVESKTIYDYINNNARNDIGEKCPEARKDTIWENICAIWAGHDGIGSWNDWDPNINEWVTPKRDDASNEYKHSLLGWIRQLDTRVRTNTTSINTNKTNINKNTTNINTNTQRIINLEKRTKFTYYHYSDYVNFYRFGLIGVVSIKGLSMEKSETTWPVILPQLKFNPTKNSKLKEFIPRNRNFVGNFSYDEAKWISLFPINATYTSHQDGIRLATELDKNVFAVAIRPRSNKKVEINATIFYIIDENKATL